MIRTVTQALAWWFNMRGSRSYNGLCQKYVRDGWNVGALFGSAIAQWNGAKYRHASLSTARSGAPVFLSHTKSRYGHVASLRWVNGVAYIETTNTALGRTALQPLSLWTANYGYRLLGWTEDINGKRVISPVAPPAPKPTSTLTLRLGSSGQRVKNLQIGLRAKFPAYANFVTVKRGVLISTDGSYGPQTKAWVEEFQRRTGLVDDGVVGPKTTAMLLKHGIVL